MKNLCTRSQVETLSRDKIEERVRGMLDYLFPNLQFEDIPPDLKTITSLLEDKYKVHFCFSKALGKLPTGEQILGMFTVSPLTVHVDPSLEIWSPRFNKTLAHELGHLVLHRKLIGDGKFISRDKPIIDTAKQLQYRATAELSDLGWVEWQANEFAMSLLLPRRYLQKLVYFMQKKLGITHNLGTLYLDDQPRNKADCHRIVGEIAMRSGTKQALLWRRLRFLEILEDHQKSRTRLIFETLDALFEIDN
jgi:hypothetical protein